MSLKVAIVDDHTVIRIGFSRMLAEVAGIEVVGTAASGEDAIPLVRDSQPHVVLMDLSMPGMGGLDASLRLLRQWPQLRILMLSATGDGPMPARLMQSGVAGYLTKGADLDEVVHAIRRVALGHRYVAAGVAQAMAEQQPDPGIAGNPFVQLSDREMQVVFQLLRERRIKDIAEHLCLSPKTVSTYRARLLQKLGVDNDMALVRLALQHGVTAAHD